MIFKKSLPVISKSEKVESYCVHNLNYEHCDHCQDGCKIPCFGLQPSVGVTSNYTQASNFLAPSCNLLDMGIWRNASAYIDCQ